MKKFLFIILSIVLAFTVNAQTIMLQSNNTGVRKINDQFTGFQAAFSYDRIESTTITGTERGTFSALSIEGAYPAGELGTPQIPVFRRMIAIPVDATPIVVVKNFTTYEYNLNDYGFHTLYPRQPDVSKDKNPKDEPFVYNEKYYGLNEYPHFSMAEVNILGTMRGVIIGMLDVYPVQYNPANHSIMVYNDIEIEVIFENGNREKTEELYVNTFSPYFKNMYDIVFNSGVTRDVYDDRPDLYSTPVRMLVVAHRMFEQTLQPWLEWKTKKGFYLDVNYTDEIGTTAAQIKTFCHNKYNVGASNGTAPTFIVFVGDTPQVPASGLGVAWSGGGSDYHRSTDLYYANPDGGYFPAMYYSRMSAQTTAQLENIIEKILYYEQYQFADPTYLDNVLLIAGADGTWAPRVGRPQINYAADNYYNAAHGFANVHKYVTSDYTGAYTHLNNVSFANYTSHCNETVWDEPRLNMTMVNALTNINKYFIAMGNCCLAADFGYGESIAELMVRAPKKGAVGYIGSAPLSFWGDDFHFTVGAYAGSITVPTNPTLANTKTGIYDFMFRDADFNSLCSHVFGGNLSVTYAHTNPGYTVHTPSPLYYWEAYNVLGDGSLMPYNAQAAVNNVSHDAVIFIGLPTYQVLADPGSYVAISKDGVLLGVAVADASGVALVTLDPPINSGGDVDIVVTRNQRQPYIHQVPAVTQSGPYPVAAGYTVIGSEKLTYISNNTEIEVTIKNVGIAATTDPTTVSIACNDPQITINTATATCGSIAPNGTATVKFKVTIANDIEDGKSFSTDITISDGTKQTWQGKLPLKAYAPKFSLAKVLIDGAEGGSLPKGSLTKITAVVENKGGAAAYKAVGGININDAHISLACDDIAGSKVDIPAGETVNFDFHVVTSPDMPSGHEANIELVLSAMYGRTYEAPFKAVNSTAGNYCTPGTTGCNSGDRFTNVVLWKTSEPGNLLINNQNGDCVNNGYSNFTTTLVPLEPGQQYTIKVKCVNYQEQIRGWFDLNGDDVFDANELLININLPANQELTQTFTIPENLCEPGEHRFRLRCRYSTTAPGTCDEYQYGQTHDYTIILPEQLPRVQNVEAELQGKSIKVTWQAPVSGTPIGYNIYRDGNPLNGATPLTNLNFTETDIVQGVYAYNVKAVYTGNKESFAEMSNVICYSYTCETPKSLAVTAESKTAILTWEKPETIDGTFEGYNVYRDGEQINTTLVTATTYSDANLKVGTYKYQVTALSDLCVETDKTEEVSVTILPEFCEPPVNITLTNEENTILITWGEPVNIDGVIKGYNVHRNDVMINEEIITEKEYRDEQPQGGYYQISAVYEHCNSELSGKVGIKEVQISSFNLYPNPTSGELTIDNGQLTIESVEIYDVFGRMQKSRKAEKQNRVTMNVSDLPAGTYFVKIYSDNNQFDAQRLVIIK